MANYSVFEVRQGAVLETVELFCRHLTTGGSFTDSSPVSLSDVEMLINHSYYWLLGELVKNGYNKSQTETDVKAVLEQIQALDVVAQVEFSMPVTDSGEPNDRYKSMAARRDRLIRDYLQTDALQQLGATKDRAKSQYLDASGRSVAAKESVYTNTDVVPGRFPRGFGQRPDTPRRSGRNTSGDDL